MLLLLLLLPNGRLLAPLGAPVLEPNLDPGLVQAQPVSQVAPSIGVRVGRLLEGGLEHAQLVVGEHGPVGRDGEPTWTEGHALD